MRKLYKFFWDCGRQGDVDGLFIADEKDIELAMGNQVYFGEILGKHSEISGTLDNGDLKVIDIEESVLDILEDAIGSSYISGYNPLDYVRFRCNNCEDSYNNDDTDWHFDENGNRFCDSCWEESLEKSEED